MSLIDRIASQRKFTYGFLALLSAFFIIGLGHIHLFDWDEINFAESAREMIRSGDYLRVQINYLPFWEKPPFFFWLQVGAMKTFGVNEFAARLPNALFGALYLFTFYKIGKRHFSAKFGIIWALVFFASILPHLYFKSGIIDPVFNYFIFLSVYFMIRVVAKDGESIWKLALYAGIFSGLSVITKGPVGFLLLGLTFGSYMIFKRFKGFPSVKSMLIFLVGMVGIIACWLSLEVAQNGFDVLRQFIEYQIELFKTPVAGHEQPFYYHFVVVALGCFPMSIFALPLFYRKKDSSPLDMRVWMLCLFWVVLILFSITTTKIIHYSSMTYAPLSFLAALSLYRIIKGELELKKFITISFLVVGALLSLVMILIPILLSQKEWLLTTMNEFAAASLRASIPWSYWDSVGGFVFLTFLMIAFINLRKKKIEKALMFSAAGTGITLLIVLFTIMPKVDSLTQGPVIAFYEEISTEDCYVETSFKSYAHYFYTDLNPNERAESKEWNWLINGDVDKPVYIITKIESLGMEKTPNFKLLKIEGGFRFYRRDP